MRVPSSAPYLYPSIFLNQWAGVGKEAGGHLPFLFTRNRNMNKYWRAFAVICLCFEDVCCHLPNLERYLLSFAEFMKGCAVICRIYDERICCHLPKLWRDLLSFAEFMNGFAIICRFVEGICCHLQLFQGICGHLQIFEGISDHLLLFVKRRWMCQLISLSC